MAPPECEIVRITAEEVGTTEKAVNIAKQAAVPRQGMRSVLLFSAIPCTGGSPRARYNIKRGPKTRAKIMAHRALAAKLWENFVRIAEVVIKHNGYVAIEWPKSCLYWEWPSVQAFVQKHGLVPCTLNGCMYGLYSSKPGRADRLLPKPWTIMTNFTVVFNAHCQRECNHDTEQHTPTEGQDTKRTENYTPAMVNRIHCAWMAQCRIIT